MLSVTNFALGADNSNSDGDQYDWLRDGRYQAAEEVHGFTTFLRGLPLSLLFSLQRIPSLFTVEVFSMFLLIFCLILLTLLSMTTMILLMLVYRRLGRILFQLQRS